MRLVLFVLTPTIYGVPNDVWYIANTSIDASFDGWPTFYGFAASLLAYLVAAAIWPRTVTEEAWSIADGMPDETIPEPVGAEPEPAV